MTNPSRGRAAALVGRDDELDALGLALRDARDGRGTTLFVAGEPGIGKTRLTAEAVGLAVEAGMAVLKGRCTATGPAVPFRPLTEALLSLTRAGEAPPADALGPYLPVLGRLVPEWSNGEDCDQSPIVLAEAVLRLAAARGKGRGCLLLIDDLHDADPETLAVIEYISANLAAQPVAVVATVRSAPSAAFELANAVSQRREGTLVPLGRLGDRQVHAFAASCLGCDPAELAEEVSAQVFADSGGIPFVAEELIRGMLAEGLLRAVDGRWEPASRGAARGGSSNGAAPRLGAGAPHRAVTPADEVPPPGDAAPRGPVTLPGDAALPGDTAGRGPGTPPGGAVRARPHGADAATAAALAAPGPDLVPAAGAYPRPPSRSGAWRGRVPFTLARAVEQRAARLGPDGVRVLSAAAVLGRAFPLSVLRRCAGPDDNILRDYLRAAVAEGLLLHDDERGPDWYAFEHPLTEEALLSLLTPVDRAELSVRAADAVDELYPGLPGTWCHLAARLRRHAGERHAAAALYLEVARRALAGSGPGTAIAVLDEAHRMLGDAPDGPVQGPVHRELLETLLFALADDGQFDRAAQVVDRLRRVDTGIDLKRRIELHVRLAWAAEVAGRWDEGMNQVAAARALLPPDAGQRDAAGIDAVEAYLTVSGAEQGRIEQSEQLARRAIEGAEQRDDPALACQAWYAVGFATRGRSLAESDRCFRRTLRIATESDLMTWRNHGLIGLGSNAWLAEATTDSLAYAHREALRTGCVSLAHNAGVMLALDAVLRSDFDHATALLDGSLDETRRLQLHSVTRYALMLRAVVAAHQGKRPQMRAALAEFRAGGGEQSREAPLARGLAELFCALLEEDREQADAVAARLAAGAPGQESFFHFSGTHGLLLLLATLDGGSREEFERKRSGQAAQMRWNRQFVELAEAVLLGREGHRAEAQQALRAALDSADVFPTARHLGLRLVADRALADGWGEPRRWLVEAEEFFHRAGVVAVAGACRSRLRTLGVMVRQRRAGTDRIPEQLRALGVTLREYDVFRLLVDRLGNKALAARLHISTRTVEKHVASLLTKTGTHDRAALCDYTADFMSTR
ncbi:AAA family ATPase [Streptomyces sp. V4-01]|uniref:AAA family ATPase n=1 Tax=Actinacidiphila polyblastidii TaxID=3110430 RepID=A0ABU7PBY7_9ACTN|nr:AAA family ATPase [Streptomyces sp. V4-01]